MLTNYKAIVMRYGGKHHSLSVAPKALR